MAKTREPNRVHPTRNELKKSAAHARLLGARPQPARARCHGVRGFQMLPRSLSSLFNSYSY
uniref:Uncharacterized protein n=1 Tax=Arundo donax TaxID=35708 RepID=A0A0A9BNY1_ARUDO